MNLIRRLWHYFFPPRVDEGNVLYRLAVSQLLHGPVSYREESQIAEPAMARLNELIDNGELNISYGNGQLEICRGLRCRPLDLSDIETTPKTKP